VKCGLIDRLQWVWLADPAKEAWFVVYCVKKPSEPSNDSFSSFYK
jgi:hypothetical protein